MRNGNGNALRATVEPKETKARAEGPQPKTHKTTKGHPKPTQSPAVVVKDLSKSFGSQVVLSGIDLDVAPGETLTVLGRSGTGKSVLLKLLIGLQKPDSGSIRIHEQEITKLSVEELNQVRKKVGFLFQEAALFDSLTIEENVMFPLRRHNHVPKGEQQEKARKLLATVGVEEHAKKLPAQISGGMKKRVGLARALAMEPDILLFDEPTAGLDPITAGEIEDLFLKLQEEEQMTAIVVTHDLHGAQVISDRLALLHEGNIVMHGTFKDLQKSDDPFVAEFLRRGN